MSSRDEPAKTAGLAALQIRSVADRIVDELRRLIVSGALEPGEVLNENRLAEQLGVSRSPVREALQRLVTERLLISERNKSVTVKKFTAADFAEIYDARLAIESHAAARVIANGAAQVDLAVARLETALVTLTHAVASGDWFQTAQADQAFHQELVRSGGNNRLVEAYRLLSAETITCMTWLENALPSGEDLVREHQDFIDCLRAHDSARILGVIGQHLTSASATLSASSPADRTTDHPAAAPQR